MSQGGQQRGLDSGDAVELSRAFAFTALALTAAAILMVVGSLMLALASVQKFDQTSAVALPAAALGADNSMFLVVVAAVCLHVARAYGALTGSGRAAVGVILVYVPAAVLLVLVALLVKPSTTSTEDGVLMLGMTGGLTVLALLSTALLGGGAVLLALRAGKIDGRDVEDSPVDVA